jgi:hypothetical protein
VTTWQLVAAGCGAAITIAVIVLLVALVRVARRLETVLAIVTQELRPLVGQAHGLTEDLRGLTDVADGVARIVTALGGLTRAGQVFGLVAAVRKGVDVFVERFRQGDHHG